MSICISSKYKFWFSRQLEILFIMKLENDNKWLIIVSFALVNFLFEFFFFINIIKRTFFLNLDENYKTGGVYFSGNGCDACLKIINSTEKGASICKKPNVTQGCPYRSIFYESFCYLEIEVKLVYSHAVDECEKLGGSLLKLTGKEQINLLHSLYGENHYLVKN